MVYAEYHKYWKSWKLGKMSMDEVYSNFLNAFNLADKKEKLMQMTFDFASLNKNMYDLAKQLKKDYKVVCLTNHAREWFSNDREKFKLDKVFNKIFTSYELGMDKPNPAIYQIALDDMDVKPEETLFIDDLERNVIAAEELGIKSIHFKSYLKLKKDMKKLGIKLK